MKSLSFLVLLTLLLALPVAAQTTVPEKEGAAIRAAMLDYLEGWYEGDEARMERALHPELTKRGIQQVPATGRTYLSYATAPMMVEYTRAGFGKLPAEERGIEVTILDVHGEMAVAKAVSAKFVDYAQLARNGDEWRIVNVLWVPVVAEQ